MGFYRQAAVLVALALLAGCAGEGSDRGPGSAIAAVATTTQAGDLVRAVGGRRVSVTQILRPNSDPHSYEPRPSDARAVEDADAVFRSGGDVDSWMGDLIDSAGGGDRTDVLIDHVRTRRGEGGTDPHWWQDPRNAALAVASIRDALTAADPAGRATYRRRARAYSARLRRLDASVAACVRRLPRGQRRLVTSHDSLGYYTERYGIRQIGAVIPSLSSQAQPSSKDVGALVARIRREHVRAVFPESSLSPKLERAIARESGASVGGALWADTLGPRGSSGATYIGSIETNTRRIVYGLSGGEISCRPSSFARLTASGP
jgi:zinc/manganese transport system substrate-binding protein